MKDIMRVVNRYIGVSGGYLGNFTYQSHHDFYPEYCDLDIDPYRVEGTTRERFIAILGSLDGRQQAKVLRGVLDRFPVGAEPSPATRAGARTEVLQLIDQLEGGALVPGVSPRTTSEVVTRAIADADALMRTSGATSAVDRVHTALHGYLLAVSDAAGIAHPNDASTTALFRLLRTQHPQLRDLGPRAQDIEKVLNSSASILDALNPIRNKTSVAHPNVTLLDDSEARLVINVAQALLAYLDSKLK